MDNYKQLLFSGSMKMADLILRNYTLLPLLSRFNIHLGFGEKTVVEVCESQGVNSHFFLMVCNIYTFEDYTPKKDDLMKVDIVNLIKYLEISHKYYIDSRINSIESRLDQFSAGSSSHLFIKKFFAEYKQEVIGHFDYEEETVFPYINRLAKGTAAVNYHIDQYEENHSNIDDKLSDLKNIIIKYLPECGASELRNEIIMDIFLFEEDLTTHTRIEDKVLIPYVRVLEKRYEKR